MKGKYCPQCGKAQPIDTKYCPQCGYDFSQLRRRSNRRPVKTRKKKILWSLSFLLLGMLIIGLLLHQRSNHYESHEVDDTSSIASSTSASSASKVESSERFATDQLPAKIGPRVSTAAITYYAIKSNTDWSSFFTLNENEGITVRLSTDEDLLAKLMEKGQGMAYEVFDYQGVDPDDQTDFVYTIDKDDKINLYKLSLQRSNSESYEPMATVPRQTIIDYLNDHHDAQAVKALGSKVVIEK